MKILKRTALLILIPVGILLVSACFVMKQKKFGKLPSGARLERILKSPNYKDGKFQNLSYTPQLAEGTSMPEAIFRLIFGKTPNRFPAKVFHFEKSDLKNLSPHENVYVWMGHSSYFLQIDGKSILVDPVLSGYASPFSFTTKAFKGSDLYKPQDIPELDFLVITHDHWDHLDYGTVTRLFPRIKKIITGLGTAEHLEFWGFDPKNIIELDWHESSDLGEGFKVTAEPARHFSGRGLKANQSLWSSFVLETPNQRIYIGGDSGYDSHFKKIGEKYGSLDLAILENGQYNKDWKYIHFLPGQNIQAMKDLNAKRMIPVHNSKFSLAPHSWFEPLQKMAELNSENLRILYPKIGEKIDWMNDEQLFGKWWETYE
ncbi:MULTISPECIES: MBL fold metallo-hydrolase [Chryseobacterium]|uniref:MBL fold metallo-hydrolase n=1 Tax=Chryseobacterium sp. R2A-55 TaxID=2744445 RepID=UPI001F4245D7|nr:MBL fold metallo-hydrolase [Chryseobacterium sp. R2A-55]